MDKILSDLNKVPGVLGSAIYDGNDNCVANAFPQPYEAILLTSVMEEFRAALNYLAAVDEKGAWTVLYIRGDNANVVLTNVGEGALIVLTEPEANFSMISVGLKVAALKLTKGGAKGGSSGAAGGGHVQPEIIKAITTALARQVGPAAKIVLKQEAEKLGFGADSVPRSRLSDLLNALMGRVGPDKQNDFRAEINKLNLQR